MKEHVTAAGVHVRVADDLHALLDQVADRFVAAALRVAAEGRPFRACLAGGETPRGLYARLARAPWRERLPWPHVVLCFGDERGVPPDHPDSNYGMVQETLLRHVPLPADNVFRIAGELPAARAAADYEARLRRLFAAPAGAPSTAPGRCFDLVLLGLGADGHTASLFPHGPALHADAWACESPAPHGPPRITLTLPLFNAARAVLFLVSGEGKADALQPTLRAPPDPERWPAAAVQPRAGELTFAVDHAALPSPVL